MYQIFVVTTIQISEVGVSVHTNTLTFDTLISADKAFDKLVEINFHRCGSIKVTKLY